MTDEPTDETSDVAAPEASAGAAAEEAPTGGGWPARARLVVAVLVVALGASLVAVGLLARGGSSSADDDATRRLEAGTEATAAATTLLQQMTSYSWHHVAHDFAWTQQGTQGFRDDLPNTAAVQKLIVQLKATATGTVVAAAPQVVDADHVTVLAFVDQTIRSQGKTGARRQQTRVQIGMVRSGSSWIPDSVDIANLLG